MEYIYKDTLKELEESNINYWNKSLERNLNHLLFPYNSKKTNELLLETIEISYSALMNHLERYIEAITE